MKKIIFVSVFLLTIMSSCTNVSEEDLIDTQPVAETTYDKDIKAIIDNNCINCHANPPINGAPVSLINYNQVKNAVQNSNLINRISAQAGSPGAMPAGGPRLPQNLIDLIIQWDSEGLLEN